MTNIHKTSSSVHNRAQKKKKVYPYSRGESKMWRAEVGRKKKKWKKNNKKKDGNNGVKISIGEMWRRREVRKKKRIQKTIEYTSSTATWKCSSKRNVRQSINGRRGKEEAVLYGRITFSKTNTAVKKRQLALVKSLQPTSFVTRKKKKKLTYVWSEEIRN